MTYVLKSDQKYFHQTIHMSYWVDQLERATVFEDEDKEYAEDVASNYRDEGREVKVQPIRMEEVE